MSATHWHADIDSAGAGCTTPPASRPRAGTAEGSPTLSGQHPESTSVEPSPELLMVRAAIKRLSHPMTEREKVRAGIIRLLTDPTVLDDDDVRGVA
jgi:hypothetical protein